MKPWRYVVKLFQLAVIFGLLFSYAMFQGGFVSWFLFYSFIPIGIYFVLFLFYPIASWKIERIWSKQPRYAGGKIEITIELKRKLGLPLPFIIIEDCFSTSLKQSYYEKDIYQLLDEPRLAKTNREQKDIQFPLFQTKLHYSYQLSELPRGSHQLRAVRVKTSDFFGFIQKQHIFPLEQSLVVYPRTKQIIIKKAPNHMMEEASPTNVAHASHTHVVTGVREYMPGDKFSWVDWKTTARKQEVMTKEFEQERNTDELFILDATYHGEANELAFEANVELLYSLLHVYDKQTVNIGLLGIGEQSLYFAPALQGKQEAIRHYLATVQAEGSASFATELNKHAKQLPASIVVHVFITNLSQEMMAVLEQLQQKVAALVIYFTKAKNTWTDEDQWYMQQCAYLGITLNLITKEKLQQEMIEVHR